MERMAAMSLGTRPQVGHSSRQRTEGNQAEARLWAAATHVAMAESGRVEASILTVRESDDDVV